MSITQSDVSADPRICLHPSVGLWADPTRMTAPQKVAAVAKVRCMENELFDGDRVRRGLSRVRAEQMVDHINELRRALGWLEINPDGKWRWPHQAA